MSDDVCKLLMELQPRDAGGGGDSGMTPDAIAEQTMKEIMERAPKERHLRSPGFRKLVFVRTLGYTAIRITAGFPACLLKCFAHYFFS